MKTLRFGSRGPQVQLLQLALNRAGFGPLATDGMFGSATNQSLMAFQHSRRLLQDGIAGPRTHAALFPWYAGYITHTIRPGDTLYRLALSYGSTVQAIETANPNLDPLYLNVGSSVVVPLNFPVVPSSIAYSSELVSFCCRGLAARYPFITLDEMGRSVMGKPLYTLTLGKGENRVFYNAAHHANEWITVPLLLRFCEELAHTYAHGLKIYDRSAEELLSHSTLSIAPAVNPDGIDLVTGALDSGNLYERARQIAGKYPSIPFPSGWKANLLGTDLNLQYPAGWEQAREIKYAQGFTSPAPRDFVGLAPLSSPESLAVYDYTHRFLPALTLSYHTQGELIFWKYLDFEPPRSREIAQIFGKSSGYLVEETPYASGFAGYKDWFIQNYDLPAYTIEAGLGQNPLPIRDFDRIYADNIGILTLGLIPADQIAQ